MCIFVLLSCSAKKFVPDGEYLLDDVRIISTTNHENAVKARNYVRQNPNARWFNFAKIPLYTYSLSGADTAKWRNKVLRRLGEAPVIYDEALSERSRDNIQKMLVNDGYLHATVDFECEKDEDKKRAKAYYYLHERERYYIESLDFKTDDEAVKALVPQGAEVMPQPQARHGLFGQSPHPRGEAPVAAAHDGRGEPVQ